MKPGIELLEQLREAAQNERAAHELRGDHDAAERSADEAWGYDEMIVALFNESA